MKLIYNNSYGAIYKIKKEVNTKYTLQLMVNNIGIFMTITELNNLLKLVKSSYGFDQNCNCKQCKDVKLNKLWKTNSFIDICLKVDDSILGFLEDLIIGTQFMLNIDTVLDEHRIK